MAAFARIEAGATAHGLLVMGALHPRRFHDREDEGGTVILLGTGPGFWPVFTASEEYRDGGADPIDRWSKRVVGAIAAGVDASTCFPSDGPPYPPFIDWALKSGRAFSSPTGMLVHDSVGLMISYRGALRFRQELDIPTAAGTSPCLNCTDRPCATACPVSALGDGTAYDVAGCHRYLDSPQGDACMLEGCAARCACPISRGAGRTPEQSAHHMKAFHPT